MTGRSLYQWMTDDEVNNYSTSSQAGNDAAQHTSTATRDAQQRFGTMQAKNIQNIGGDCEVL
jgi:hypothetical protein